MSEPFLGEISPFGFNFAPRGWVMCDGQLLSISQYSALFSLLGTTYGGDGRTTFGVPDLRGRVPIHEGDGPGLSDVRLGQKDGVENVTLTTSQIASHSHPFNASTDDGDTNAVTGKVLADPPGSELLYGDAPTTPVAMNPAAVSDVGGQAHNNMQPFLTLTYCIAIQGTFPSRN